MDRINGAGHVNHMFVAEDVPTNRPPTEITEDWLNGVQEELAAFPLAVGQTLDPNNNHQALDAVRTLIEARVGDYSLDTGTANAKVVALNPAINAYTGDFSGLFKNAATNTGACTVNFGAGAVSLVSDVGGALAANDLPASAVIGYQYIHADGKAYVTSMVTSTAAQFDNTTKTATTEFVRRQGHQFAGVISLGSSHNLQAADMGKLIISNGASLTLTVGSPASLGVPSGGEVTIIAYQGTDISIVFSGSVYSYGISGQTATFQVKSGESITLTAVDAGGWFVSGGLAALDKIPAFSASIAPSGYQKLPSGLIVQWGAFTNNVNSNKTVTFPIAFVTACYSVVAQTVDNAGTAPPTIVNSVNAASFAAISPSATAALYFAVGK